MADEIRIGDAEREEVLTTLRTAFAEGRLDQIELDDRLSRVYTAKTTTDLVPITRDLPSSLPPAPASPGIESFLAANSAIWAGPLGICAMVTVIYAMTNFGGYFWPMWVYFGMGFGTISALFAKYQRDRS